MFFKSIESRECHQLKTQNVLRVLSCKCLGIILVIKLAFTCTGEKMKDLERPHNNIPANTANQFSMVI